MKKYLNALMKTSTLIKIAAAAILLLVVMLVNDALRPEHSWKSGATTVTYSPDGTLRVRASMGISVSYWWEKIQPQYVTVKGRGAMRNYYHTYPAWHSQSDKTTALVIEEGVTHIGAYAFHDSLNNFGRNLTSIMISSSVTYIGGHAFSSYLYAFSHHMNALTSVTVLNPNPPQYDIPASPIIVPNLTCRSIDYSIINTFGCDSLADSLATHRPTYLYVPENSIAAYRADNGWNIFECIKPITAEMNDDITGSNGGRNKPSPSENNHNEPIWAKLVVLLLWFSYCGLVCFAIYGLVTSPYLLFWFILKKIYRGDNKVIKIMLKILSALFTIPTLAFLVLIFTGYYCYLRCWTYCLHGMVTGFVGLFLTLARQFYPLYRYYIKKAIKRPIVTIVLTACHVIFLAIWIAVAY